MDLALLGRALALAFASGVNFYATVGVVGLSVAAGWVVVWGNIVGAAMGVAAAAF